MKLSFQESGKYAGMLALPSLCILQKEFNIEYTANILLSEPEKIIPTSSKKTTVPNHVHNCSVRIVVYGAKSEGNSVGRLLSGGGLYFQHPSAAEINRHIDYWNPHYLVRPGSQMPKLEDLSISSESNDITPAASMDEVHRNRVMQIFNCAMAPVPPINPTPSPRLKTKLKESVTSMVGRNC